MPMTGTPAAAENMSECRRMPITASMRARIPIVVSMLCRRVTI